MLYKNVSDSSIGGVIKDVDTKTGTVTGYFSIFGNVDSDGDMIMPGAFKATLNTAYKRVKHLNQHRSYEPLSGVKNGNLVVSEDARGLFFESKISQTSYGKDVIQLYNDGVLDEHSIGYEVVKQQKAKGYNELLELRLWEGSTVTWGANEMAGVESIKSLTKEQAFEKMNGILKAIKNGKYEQEEIFEMLELHFKQLQQHIIDLSSSPGDVVSPVNPQKSVDDLFDTDMILSYLHLQTFNSN
jgi:uncharacterized protein